MRKLFLAIGVAMAGGPEVGAASLTVDVWPGRAPGEETFRPPAPRPSAKSPKDDNIIRIAMVTEPTLTVFRPAAVTANGAAVIVCPGGGYNILAWDKEGTEVAEWLNTIGITAAVLKYRVPRRDSTRPHAAPLQDAQRAIRQVRQRAGEWGVDPARVGILGFSAGGNLAVMAATHWRERAYPPQDRLDEIACRPDFVVAIYPAYLGNEDNAGPLSPLVQITSETPPMFIAVAHDDKLRGLNAALLYVELKKVNVSAELHIFSHGGHGFGLRPSGDPVSQWPKYCEDWLRGRSLIEPMPPGGQRPGK